MKFFGRAAAFMEMIPLLRVHAGKGEKIGDVGSLGRRKGEFSSSNLIRTGQISRHNDRTRFLAVTSPILPNRLILLRLINQQSRLDQDRLATRLFSNLKFLSMLSSRLSCPIQSTGLFSDMYRSSALPAMQDDVINHLIAALGILLSFNLLTEALQRRATRDSCQSLAHMRYHHVRP